LKKTQSAKLPNYKITPLQIPMIPRPRKSAARRRSERGYILITLILFVALVAITALVMAPLFTFQAKRDREEELIHRGTQYSRAMKHFVKKFGRYPTRIEELENTNQVRFLRRRYKDPITGKDFKLLHMGDVQMSFGGGIPGASPAGGLAPGAPGAPGVPGMAGPGGLPGGPNGALNSINGLAAAGGLAAGGFAAGGLAAGGINGGAGVGGPTSPFSAGSNGAAAGTATSNSDDDSGGTAGSTPNQGAGPAGAGPGAPGAPGQGTPGPNGQTFGGGPVVGVASTSKDKSVRVFNKKEHYNEWQFIYDPSTDRGGILTTPNQPSLQAPGAAPTGVPGAAGAPGAPGAAGGPFNGPGGFPGQPGGGPQPGQPPQAGPQTPQMPPDQ
jgi:type II secretory pathway pseudopilin PulG